MSWTDQSGSVLSVHLNLQEMDPEVSAAENFCVSFRKDWERNSLLVVVFTSNLLYFFLGCVLLNLY